jgi:hypothetical protein
VAIDDLDGDENLDLAVGNSHDHTVSVLLGNGDGSFQSHVTYSAVKPLSVAIGDLDGDGHPDLAVASGSPVWPLPAPGHLFSVLLNRGDGTFQPSVTYAAGTGPSSVGVADLDGDGDLDLVGANDRDHSISILSNRGDGTFQDAVMHGRGIAPASLAIDDLDGDGDLDLAVANRGNSVSILLNECIP